MGIAMFLAGVQGAFAANCAGTAYIKTPATWTDLYIYYGNESTKVPATALDAASGYYVFNLAQVTGNDNSTFIVYTTTDGTNIDRKSVV